MTGPKRVTEAQLAANRANAQRSTGPRTAQGRAAVRYNALKHGILAQAIIPEALEPYEAREDFDHLLATLRDEFAPANTIEELLVEQIAIAYWRLSRLYRAEAGAIAMHQDAIEQDNGLFSTLLAMGSGLCPKAPDPMEQRLEQLGAAEKNKARLRKLVCEAAPALVDASDEEIRAAAEREIHQLLAELRERAAQEQHHRQAVRSAVRSLPDLDAALKFARYETALQNQLDRALSRLERLQRLRGGEFVAPPLQIEISHTDGLNDDAQ